MIDQPAPTDDLEINDPDALDYWLRHVEIGPLTEALERAEMNDYRKVKMAALSAIRQRAARLFGGNPL